MNQKGGVGKTTLLVLVASALSARKKLKLGVIDADPQHSIFKLREAEKKKGTGFEIIPFSWKKEDTADFPLLRFKELINEKEREFDYLFIDSPGRLDGEEVPLILTVSDFVIVPLVGSFDDVQSTLGFLQVVPPILNKKLSKGYSLEVIGLINKKDKTLEYNELEKLKGVHGLKLFNTFISYKARYKRKSTIKDIIPGKDSDEFNLFLSEFCKKVKIK
jgi:chromosome partitioning protein